MVKELTCTLEIDIVVVVVIRRSDDEWKEKIEKSFVSIRWRPSSTVAVYNICRVLFRPWCYAPSIILCNSQQSASKGWGKYNIYQYLLFLCIIGETLNAFLTTIPYTRMHSGLDYQKNNF